MIHLSLSLLGFQKGTPKGQRDPVIDDVQSPSFMSNLYLLRTLSVSQWHRELESFPRRLWYVVVVMLLPVAL